jgi:glycosyl transferase family 1
MIRKVMTVTINYDHPQWGMQHAFSSLFEHTDFDYLALQRASTSIDDIGRRFVEMACSFKPDWIWGQYQNTAVIQADVLSEIRRQLPQCVLTSWMGDCRATVSDYLASICKVTHASFIAAAGQRNLFQAAGAEEVHYVQCGIDWHEDFLEAMAYTPPFRVPQVVMIGNHYGPSFPGTPDRERAMRALRDAGFDMGVVGMGWPGDIPTAGQCHVKEQIGVWKRARVGVSISHFNDIPLYYSDRQLISMLSGTPIVCRRVPQLEEEFEDGVQCLFFDDPDELVENVQWLLKNPVEAKRIGEAGRAEVLRSHTWFARIFQLLPIIERLQRRLTH